MEPADFYRENEIELWLADSVFGLDLAANAVTTAANRAVTFGSCVLATGNEPTTLPVPGGDHPEVLRLRFLQQARILRRAASQARSAVIVGSGFIGCEAAASLAARGLDVVVLSMEELPQLGRLGRSAAERVAGWLADAEVRMLGEVDVSDIYDGRIVRTKDATSRRTPSSRLPASRRGPRWRSGPVSPGRTAASSWTSGWAPRRRGCSLRAMSRSPTTHRRPPAAGRALGGGVAHG